MERHVEMEKRARVRIDLRWLWAAQADRQAGRPQAPLVELMAALVSVVMCRVARRRDFSCSLFCIIAFARCRSDKKWAQNNSGVEFY